MKKYNVTVNGTVYEVEIEEVAEFAGNAALAAPKTAPAPKAVSAPKAAPAPGAAGGKAIKAPMPGTIVGINVNVGQKVAKGTVVAVLEAMKMENEIFAPEDCTIASINVSKGSTVAAEDVIITVN